MSSLRPFMYLAGFAIVLALLYAAKIILVPIALAVLLAFGLSPVVAGLERLGAGRVVSVLLVAILAALLFGGIGTALAWQIKGLGEQLPKYHENIAAKIAALHELGGGKLLEKTQEAVQSVERRLKAEGKRTATAPAPVPVQVVPSGFSELGHFVGPAVQSFATAGLVIVLVAFMLIYQEDLRNRVIRLTGHGRLLMTTRAMDEASRRISRYLVAQLVINSSFGVILGTGLFFIGVPYALLWGVLAAILRFIPYVGGWLIGVLPLAVSVAVFPGWTQPMLVVALVVVLELLTSQVAEPLLFGHSTGVSPVALIVAAAFWTWLWGPIGLALSAPLTTCVVVLGKYVPDLEFFGILLGDEEVLGAELGFYQRLLANDQDEAVGLVEDYLQAHPSETIYDDILVPALVLAKRDRARGGLTADDEKYIHQVIREILDDVLSPPSSAAEETATANEGPRAIVLGCAARDEADELALLMFRQLVELSQCHVEVESLAADSPAGRTVARIKEKPPALVCIAALPPGGLTQARALCKRFHAAAPEEKILIGRWGGTPEHAERLRGSLPNTCADQAATTLRESLSQCLAIVQAATADPHG